MPVHFFNAKENDPESVRDALIDQIASYRGRYCGQIVELSAAVDHLIQNQDHVATQQVFDHVSQRLATWIDKNRDVDWNDIPVHAPLVKAIGETRYAATVRAAIRRQGHWQNLDYYHQLARGSRNVAVKVIGGRIAQFKIIVQNLIDDDVLDPAREFLSQVVQSLDVNVASAYRTLELAGQMAYKEEMQRDFDFWHRCERRWGASRLVAGGKFRDEIRDMTDEQLQSSYSDAHQLLKEMISKEWDQLIGVLEEMLKEKGSEVGVPKKRE